MRPSSRVGIVTRWNVRYRRLNGAGSALRIGVAIGHGTASEDELPHFFYSLVAMKIVMAEQIRLGSWRKRDDQSWRGRIANKNQSDAVGRYH